MKHVVAALGGALLCGVASGEPTAEELARPADAIQLQPVPGFAGLTAAILQGNPNEAGPYTIRVRFPAGVMSPPHTHDRDRFITVIEGIWHFGLGASGRCEDTLPLAAGSFAKHPAGVEHFDGSCGAPVTVQISGEGPVETHALPITTTP